MTKIHMNRIAEARAETVTKLEKALSFSPDLQKPAQIRFYRAHIDYLDKLAAGEPCKAPQADSENWDTTQAVIDARASKSAKEALDDRITTLRAIFDEDRQGSHRWRRSHTEALFNIISDLQQQVLDGQKERQRVEALHADAMHKWRMGGRPESLTDAARVAFNAAIDFALDGATAEGLTFLRLWREGDWEAIGREFPEFHAPQADAGLTPAV